MKLDGATFLLQWAAGGLAFCWVTTRHRQVSLGYGWLLRSVYGVMAIGAAALFATQEQTTARTLALASDWYYLGRVQTFDEIEARIEALNPRSILDHLHRVPPRDFRIVTLGPQPLAIPSL